jgi:steroid delta-isomerase-like uncharacterized protein
MGTARDLWHQYETLDSMGDVAGFASLFATDGVYVDSAGRLERREAIRARAEMVHRAFPDLKINASLVVENAGTVIAEWTWRATNTGPLALPDGTEMPATGKTVELLGVSVVEVRDGRSLLCAAISITRA